MVLLNKQISKTLSWIILIHVLISLALVGYHIHAESSSSSIAGNNNENNNNNNNNDENENENDYDHDVFDRIISGPNYWNTMDKIVFAILIMMGMELLGWIVRNSGDWMKAKQIPVRGKHLDQLTTKDLLFIGISKAQTGPFVYFFLRFVMSDKSNVIWDINKASLRSIILPLPIIFIVFDFFYTSLHWALHIKAIYSYVHKHHHIQKAPSRGNDDAVNVHPIEFFLGEYNHLWSWYLCCQCFGLRVHAIGALVYLIVSGLLAGWNHTRYDITFGIFGLMIFDSKAHDVHHRIPQSNYGQYTMFWDTMFGTFRSYDPKDRINPNSQLDPKTGLSIEYIQGLKKQKQTNSNSNSNAAANNNNNKKTVEESK